MARCLKLWWQAANINPVLEMSMNESVMGRILKAIAEHRIKMQPAF